MGSSQSSPTPTSDEIEAVRDRREMSSMVSGIVLDPSERLFDSCWRGDVKGCKRDLRDGAHVDWAHHIFNGRTALHAAAFSGNLECCEILIAAGATINQGDCDGQTPKDWAVRTFVYVFFVFLFFYRSLFFFFLIFFILLSRSHVQPILLTRLLTYSLIHSLFLLTPPSCSCGSRRGSGNV